MIQPFYLSKEAAVVAMLNDTATYLTLEDSLALVPEFRKMARPVNTAQDPAFDTEYIYQVDPFEFRQHVTDILKERARV